MSNRTLPAHTGTARVRLATPQDEEEILGICHRLHAENGLMPLCDRKMREVLNEAFEAKGGIIGVIGAPGKIEGCILLRIGQMWYSDEWCLDELFNFVLPEYRRSRNALELVEFAKTCAERLHIPLFIGIISNERTASKVKLYERRLKKPAGAFFIYNDESIQQRRAG